MTATAGRPTERTATRAAEGVAGAGRVRTALRGLLARPHASLQLVVLCGAGLAGFGLLMAVSTTIAAAHESDDFRNVGGSIWGQAVKAAVYVIVGLGFFWVAARMRPRGFRMLAYPLLIVSTILLVAVLVPGVGVEINEARRWLALGPFQFQPSELGKLAILLWAADLLTRKQQLRTLKRARHLFVPLLPGFVMMIGLVMLEPDLGTTLCFMLILLGVLWMVGMPMRYFGLMLAVVALAVTVLAVVEPYRLERLTTFVDPWKDAQSSGYHTVEGLYALASGGIFGVGLGQGTSKYGWVPNANSDYVFAIIGEELGLVGCLTVIALFALFAYTGMRIVRRTADPFVRVAGGGATIWLVGQAVINIGYVTGLLPVTGITLPLISAGGTSLLITFFVMGMLASFARHERDAVNAARKRQRLGRRTRLERWCRIPVPSVPTTPKAPARRVTAVPTPLRAVPAARSARPARPGTAPRTSAARRRTG
ncbi:FtsW/RodA/SpoVE family cell cycle protein [Jatrophihabitans fulvus]